jgi:hypothetical protein
VIIGGGASYGHALGAPSPDRLAEATRGCCIQAAPHPLPNAGRPIDPALLALIGLLGDAQPPVQQPQPAQRLLGQLAAMLSVVTARLAALRSAPGAVSGGGPEQPAADVRAADAPGATLVPPRVPLQPPPPTLTMDPALGIIVEVEPGALDGAGGSTGGDDDVEDEKAPFPTAWLPDGMRRHIDRIGARLDSLLADRGLSRWHLLLLTLAAPVIVVFLIDVVSTMLGGV